MSLHAAFHKQLQTLPRTAIEQVLSNKLKAAGIRAHRAVASKLIEHLSSGSEEPFKWGKGDSEHAINIEFDDDDIKRLEAASTDAVEAIPDIVSKVAKRIAASIADQYIFDWKSYRYVDEREWRGFRDRLEDRWGIGLDSLRVLLSISRHLGQAAFERVSVSKARKGRVKNSLLCQLHIRACQISAEILTLLENGFADGALARWRTIHEVSIVALVIADNDDELARRYIDHDAVEAKKSLDRYDKDHSALRERAIAKRSRAHIERNFNRVVSKYGSSFKTEYGWAADLLSAARPRFIDLQEQAGRGLMHSHYKNASYNVHAGSRALTLRTGRKV